MGASQESALPVGASQETLLETQRQHWERGRADALASLKQRLAVQRVKLGASTSALTAAQEVAKKAQEAGGGIEETKQAEELAGEVQSVQTLIDTMEGQRQSLESEAFGKAAAPRQARAAPF